MLKPGWYSSLEALVAATAIGNLLIAVAVLIFVGHFLVRLPPWVFRSLYALGATLLFWYAAVVIRLRLVSPEVAVSGFVAQTVIAVAGVVAICAIWGFRETTAFPYAVAIASSGPLILTLVRIE